MSVLQCPPSLPGSPSSKRPTATRVRRARQYSNSQVCACACACVCERLCVYLLFNAEVCSTAFSCSQFVCALIFRNFHSQPFVLRVYSPRLCLFLKSLLAPKTTIKNGCGADFREISTVNRPCYVYILRDSRGTAGIYIQICYTYMYMHVHI